MPRSLLAAPSVKARHNSRLCSEPTDWHNSPRLRSDMAHRFATHCANSFRNRRPAMEFTFDPDPTLPVEGRRVPLRSPRWHRPLDGSRRCLRSRQKPCHSRLSWIKAFSTAASSRRRRTEASRSSVDPTFVSGGQHRPRGQRGQRAVATRRPAHRFARRREGEGVFRSGDRHRIQKSPYGVISLAKSPIKTPQDMKGKTIAVSTSGRPPILYMVRKQD